MKKILLLVVLVSFILPINFSNADGIYKRVKFKKGESSASYENSVVRGDKDIYVLTAKKYQVMTVGISSVEDNAVFQIKDKRTGRMLYGAAAEECFTVLQMGMMLQVGMASYHQQETMKLLSVVQEAMLHMY